MVGKKFGREDLFDPLEVEPEKRGSLKPVGYYRAGSETWGLDLEERKKS